MLLHLTQFCCPWVFPSYLLGVMFLHKAVFGIVELRQKPVQNSKTKIFEQRRKFPKDIMRDLEDVYYYEKVYSL